MSKSIGRVFGIGEENPYGYETDYMQYLQGYNPYDYEQTLKNMMVNAVNVNTRPPYQIRENQSSTPAYSGPTKAYSPSNSPSDMLYKDWLITNEFLNRLKQNAAENEDDTDYNLNTTMQGSDYSLKLPEFDDSRNYTTESAFGYPNDTSSPYYQQMGRPYNYNVQDEYQLGTLSGLMESSENPSVIGTDNAGGPSYGQYQIATTPGTMKKYIDYLLQNQQYSDYARMLNDAGGDYGAKNKSEAFVNTWIELSKDKDFNQSQLNFLVDTHLQPLINNIKNQEALDLNNRHPVVRDALYSLSVQHRNAAQIVNQTIQELHQKYGNNISDSMFLNALYKNRAEYVRSLPESEYKGDKKITKQEKYNIINKRYPYELNRALKYLK